MPDMYYCSVVPESPAVIKWLQETYAKASPENNIAWVFGAHADGALALSKLNRSAMMHRDVYWLMYDRGSDKTELQAVVDDLTQRKPQSANEWTFAMQRIMSNCRWALLPWSIDVSLAAYLIVSKDLSCTTWLKSEIAHIAPVEIA